MIAALQVDLNDPEQARAARIGLAAGEAVVASRLQDGMNQLGDADGSRYNRKPYADYTGFKPFNSAYWLWDPRFWQPAIETANNGLFSVQQFVTPQMEFTQPFLTAHPKLRARRPRKSYAVNRRGKPRAPYIAQADEVLEVSANLTDEQKMTAELFEDKIDSLGLSSATASAQLGYSLFDYLEVNFPGECRRVRYRDRHLEREAALQRRSSVQRDSTPLW